MTAQATPAKVTFDQEVLDQVTIFNEIITYLKSHVITSISSKTNQYFETVDCKYEYVDKKLTITVKPSSAIYPKIQSLKLDVLNKFDVQIINADEIIEKIKALSALIPGIRLEVNGTACSIKTLIKEVLAYERSVARNTLCVNGRAMYSNLMFRLGDPYDTKAIDSLYHRFLNCLETIDTDAIGVMRHEAYIDVISYHSSGYYKDQYVRVLSKPQRP